MTKRLVLTFTWLTVLSGYGLLSGGGRYAGATTALTSCGSGGTCVGDTSWWQQWSGSDYLYWADGTSQSSYPVPSGFAWIHGTNIYHSGTAYENVACNYYNGTTCTTAAVNPCSSDRYPAGCGPDYQGHCAAVTDCWYATTWSYWDTGAGAYSVFTASDGGRASAYCWTNMNCF